MRKRTIKPGAETAPDKIKITKSSGSVFADLGFEAHEAENLRLRSQLMQSIENYIEKCGLTQSEAAKKLGITQPRLNDLLKGKINKFSLDALVNIVTRTGKRIVLNIRKAA